MTEIGTRGRLRSASLGRLVGFSVSGAPPAAGSRRVPLPIVTDRAPLPSRRRRAESGPRLSRPRSVHAVSHWKRTRTPAVRSVTSFIRELTPMPLLIAGGGGGGGGGGG